ncbi:MAG: NADH-quinone oxidoreductase subunit NuoE [Jatrophihabitantaceae bacterium]
MANTRLSLIDIGRPGDPAVFDADVRTAALEIMARYPAGQARSALLPMLHLVQSEQGYVSADGIAFCAELLGLTKAQVAAVATFYTMYKRSPTGEYLVSVCTNTLCAMLGGDEIYQALSELLGVGMNQTAGTAGQPGSITLEHAECLAACDYAPIVTVNYEFFDNQSVESATNLVTELRAGNRPQPSRGAPLCSFREISRQIAGFVDQRPASIRAAATGPQTEAGVRLAQQLDHQAPGYPPGDDAGSSSADAERTAADNSGKPDYTSSNDAPLNTVKSDPAAGSPTGGQSERIDRADEAGKGK